MTSILYSGQSISLVIPSGQRLVVSTEAGTYSAMFTAGANNGVVLADNSMLGATYGPYVEHEVILLAAGEGAIVSFEVGVNPSLNHHPVSRYVFDVNGNVNGFLAPDGSVYNPSSLYMIYASDAGLIGDGTTNNSPLLAAARTAAAGRKIVFPAGTFKFNSAVSSGEDLVIEGQGDDTILDFTGATGTYALDTVGTTTALPDLAIDAVAGERTVQFASAPPLVVGDVFAIYNPTDFSWSGFKNTYRAGEWCEVHSVAGNVVTLVSRLYDSYAVADVDLYRMNSPKVSIKNIKVIGSTMFGLINATLCNKPLFENVSGINGNNSVISIDRCFKHRIVNPNVVNIGDGDDDYGIVIGNSQHGRTLDGSSYGRRHGVAYGGGAGICSVPFRDNIVDGTSISNDRASGVEAADFHGNGEYNEYRNCTIKGGAKLQGKDNFYKNCTIHDRLNGVVIHHAEVKGGTLGTIGCTFITTENPQPTARGIYDIGGNNAAFTSDTVLDVTIVIKDCSLNGKNLTSLTTFALFDNNGATVKINFDIDGLTGDVNALSAILRTEASFGTPDSDFIIVDRISGFNTGAAVSLHTAVGGDYLAFPHRLQKQTGSVTLSAASGTSSTVASPINFKYTYPKAPAAHADAVGGINGNRVAIAGLFTLTGSAIRPLIYTGDAVNWTATANRDVYWTASIDEV